MLSLGTRDGAKTGPASGLSAGTWLRTVGPLQANLVPTVAADGVREQSLCSVGETRRAANQRQGAELPGFPRGEVPLGRGRSVIVSVVH